MVVTRVIILISIFVLCTSLYLLFYSKMKIETKIIQAAGEDCLDWGGGRGFGEKWSDS